jgi:hypothetical protein
MKGCIKIIEREGVSQQAHDDYAKVFGKPLTNVHLEALASLFNWSRPEFDVRNRGEAVVS